MQPPYQAHTVKIYLQLHPNAQEAEAGETGPRAHRPVASRGGLHTPASQVSLGPNHHSRALQPVPGSKERASEKAASWGAILSGLHHLGSCCSELSGKQLYLLCTGPKPNPEGWLDLHHQSPPAHKALEGPRPRAGISCTPQSPECLDTISNRVSEDKVRLWSPFQHPTRVILLAKSCQEMGDSGRPLLSSSDSQALSSPFPQF